MPCYIFFIAHQAHIQKSVGIQVTLPIIFIPAGIDPSSRIHTVIPGPSLQKERQSRINDPVLELNQFKPAHKKNKDEERVQNVAVKALITRTLGNEVETQVISPAEQEEIWTEKQVEG